MNYVGKYDKIYYYVYSKTEVHMDHSQIAYDNFYKGYNCAQSVFSAFCDLTGLDLDTSLLLSSSFGGGMGRLREVCGAFSAIIMAAGCIYGYTAPNDYNAKSEHYALVQELAKRFKEQNSSIVCREILGLSAPDGPDVAPRTDEYYAKRPCAQICRNAAKILDDYIRERGDRRD